MRDENCPECVRLWGEYTDATKEDIKVDGQRKLALLRYDFESSKQLTIASDTTAQKREALRQQIKQHESTHGPDRASAEINQIDIAR